MNGSEAFAARAAESPAYWMLDILWTILIDNRKTGGRASLLEQLMPEGAAPPPHVHPFGTELFFVLSGEIAFQAGDRALRATEGTAVAIPRNTVHSFTVENGTAHVLNFYVPGGWDEVFPDLARRAERRELPPPGLDDVRSPEVTQFLTNYWGTPASHAFARRPSTGRAFAPLAAAGEALVGPDDTPEGLTLRLVPLAPNAPLGTPLALGYVVEGELLSGEARLAGGTAFLPGRVPLSAGRAGARVLALALPPSETPAPATPATDR